MYISIFARSQPGTRSTIPFRCRMHFHGLLLADASDVLLVVFRQHKAGDFPLSCITPAHAGKSSRPEFREERIARQRDRSAGQRTG